MDHTYPVKGHLGFQLFLRSVMAEFGPLARHMSYGACSRKLRRHGLESKPIIYICICIYIVRIIVIPIIIILKITIIFLCIHFVLIEGPMCTGIWNYHPNLGREFKATRLRASIMPPGYGDEPADLGIKGVPAKAYQMQTSKSEAYILGASKSSQFWQTP